MTACDGRGAKLGAMTALRIIKGVVTHPKRIALDARTLLGAKTGDRTYTLNLLRGLEQTWADWQGAKIARFGDNMRDVAVTEGNKVQAQIQLGYDV